MPQPSVVARILDVLLHQPGPRDPEIRAASLLTLNESDPLSSAADYDYMLGISPYENVRPAPYPPLFTTAGLKDDRVGYWEPAKLVAAVRAASTARAPALLLTDLAAGHQGSAGRDSVNHKMARLYAFAQGCVDGSLA